MRDFQLQQYSPSQLYTDTENDVLMCSAPIGPSYIELLDVQHFHNKEAQKLSDRKSVV